MEIYGYDKLGVYSDTRQADTDPLDTNRFLVPSGYTINKPPTAGSGKVAVFTLDEPAVLEDGFKGFRGSWAVEGDRRGEVVYDTNTKNQEVVKYVGSIKSTHTTKAPTSRWQEWDGSDWVGKTLKGDELEEWKKIRLSEIRAETNKKLSDGVEFDGKKFQVRRDDIGIWVGIKDSIKSGEVTLPYDIIAQDDTIYPLTQSKATSFFTALVIGSRKILFDGNKEKRAVRDLTEYTYGE